MDCEYLVIKLPDSKFDQEHMQTLELRKFARDRWELVCVSNGMAYLKREVKETTKSISGFDAEYIDVSQLETMVKKLVANEIREAFSC